MKKYIFYTLATVVTFLTFSCSKDTEVQTPDKPVPVDPIVATEKSVVLSGDVDATKVSSDNNGAYKWQASDIITILTDNGTNREFTAEEAGISTDFSGHIPDADKLEGGFALYPASENHSISGTTITFNMPNELAWGADASYMPMYAPITIVEQKPSASFKAVGGALKLILYNIPSGAAYLAFTAASVNIAGNFSLDTTAETPVLYGDGIGKEIDINFSDNYSANKVFYIPLPPVTLTGGFTISIFDDEANELFSVTSTKGITIGRNKLVIAPALNCGAPPTADDQLTNSDITGSGLGGSYADVVITSATGKTWNVNAMKSSSRIQLKKDVTTSYIQLPAYDDNIASVVLNGVYNGSGNAYTGTIKIVTALNDGEELASVTPSISAGDNVSLSLPDGNKSGYIISNDAALQITSITVKFRGIDYPTISADSEELTIPVGDLSVSTDVTLSYPVDGLGVSALLGNNADWIDTAVIENGELTVTAKAANTTDTDRVATVTLKASGASNKDISVTQKSCVVPNPTDLAAIAGEEIATITWTKEAHATSYLAFLHTATTATPATGGTDVFNSAQLSDGVYTIALDGLTNNQTYYLYVKVNEVADNYQSPTGYEHVEFTPVADVWDLKSVTVSTAPTNTSYEAGEFFDPTGMVVTATFENHDNTEQTKEETVDNASLTFTPSTSTALTTEDTSVEISYTVDAITKSTTQTITVTAVPNEYYGLISQLEDVVAGQYVITWDNSYYLPNTAVAKNPSVGSGITVSNRNRLTNVISADMVWTFTGDNTNGFAVTAGDNRLHSTNAAQGISVKAINDSEITWKASINNTKGMLLSGSDGGTRNLAVYNNDSWRYYAAGNDYVGVLRLYKLVDNTVWNLKSIAVTTPPTKTSYEAGETFDPTGMVVTATYQDQAGVKADKTEPIANGDLTFSPDLETALTTDDESVSISYGGQSTTQSITVTAPVTWDLKSITVTTAPTKTTYTEGDTFDPAGMVVTAHYEDHNDNTNTKDEIVSNGDLTFSPSTSKALTTSDVSVTITYNGKSTTQSITVNVAVNYVKVTSLSNVTAGEYIIVNDGYYLPNAAATSSGPSKVAVTISNDKVQNVTSAMTWTFTGSASAMTIQSTAEATNKYLCVSGGSNNSLRVNSTSGRTWTIGNYSGTSGAFTMKDNTNNRYCATYSGGSDWRSYGSYDHANYGDGGRVYLYKLEDNTQWNLKSIAVTTPPTKTNYEAGENFDPTGMVVTATYEDQAGVKADKTEPIANGDLTFSPSTSTALTTSDVSVTITYSGKSTSQAITVTAPVTWDLNSIAVTTAPTKTTYTEGEYFNPAGMVVTATFENHDNTEQTKQETVDNANLTFTPNTSTALTTSNVSVTISYTVSGINKTTSQAITVNASGGGEVVNASLNTSEITSNITTPKCAYGTVVSYNDASDGIHWYVDCYTDSAGRPWMQMKSGSGYIRITASGTISSVTLSISNASNSKGGVADITKHGDFSGTVTLSSASSLGTTLASGTPSNKSITLNPTGTPSEVYILVSGAVRIWEVDVTYTTD